MRLKEFATPDAQLELWKMVSDAVWAAISKQNTQQGQSSAATQPDPAAVARAQDAKLPRKPAPAVGKLNVLPKKKGAPKKPPKIPVPPVKPSKPPKPAPKAKQKQIAMAPAQAPVVPASQRQQTSAIPKPAMSQPPQPQIVKNYAFGGKSGGFQQNPRLLKPKPTRG
jgi:hypothetical protein